MKPVIRVFGLNVTLISLFNLIMGSVCFYIKFNYPVATHEHDTSKKQNNARDEQIKIHGVPRFNEAPVLV